MEIGADELGNLGGVGVFGFGVRGDCLASEAFMTDAFQTGQRVAHCPHYPWGQLLEKDELGCTVCWEGKPTHRVSSIDIENKVVHFETLPGGDDD